MPVATGTRQSTHAAQLRIRFSLTQSVEFALKWHAVEIQRAALKTAAMPENRVSRSTSLIAVVKRLNTVAVAHSRSPVRLAFKPPLKKPGPSLRGRLSRFTGVRPCSVIQRLWCGQF